MSEGNDLYGYTTEDYWCDVGDIGSYIQSHIDILEGKVNLDLTTEFENRNGIYVGKNVEIDPTAKITAPVVIGNNCKIGKNVELQEYTVCPYNSPESHDGTCGRALRCHDAGARNLEGTVS
jgi:mannose-1-phosphate guanylyltransferase/phosphomannomutase